MADAPNKELIFAEGCGDCGERRVDLPAPFPDIPDDFDWLARDYDSIRLFMMEELAHRFPARKRWTPADMEVVIVEALAAALDRLSHSLDIVHGEAFLESARRPQSVRRLLALIGYDAAARIDPALFADLPALPRNPDGTPGTETPEEAVERLWTLVPEEMERARDAGPRLIGEQLRMVTLADHANTLAAHPLVERGKARLVWTGSWNTILVALLLPAARQLDDPLHVGAPAATPSELTAEVWSDTTAHHRERQIPLPPITEALTSRAILAVLVEKLRMIGAEIFLEDARLVPITFWLSAQAKPGFYRSEVRDGIAATLSAGPGGLFEPGNLDFGDAVYASNIIERAMAVEGVATACLNRFKRMGRGFGDQTDSGRIAIAPDEIAICQNEPGAPERGVFEVTVSGGEVG